MSAALETTAIPRELVLELQERAKRKQRRASSIQMHDGSPASEWIGCASNFASDMLR